MTGMAWWSQTAASNANGNGDTACGFAEGQAPSSLNDGVRALMASAAKWRDDIGGSLTTGGSPAIRDCFPRISQLCDIAERRK